MIVLVTLTSYMIDFRSFLFNIFPVREDMLIKSVVLNRQIWQKVSKIMTATTSSAASTSSASPSANPPFRKTGYKVTHTWHVGRRRRGTLRRMRMRTNSDPRTPYVLAPGGAGRWVFTTNASARPMACFVLPDAAMSVAPQIWLAVAGDTCADALVVLRRTNHDMLCY